MKYIVLSLALLLSGCSLHMCGNTEIAHQVGDGNLEESATTKDEAKADTKIDATLPVK